MNSLFLIWCNTLIIWSHLGLRLFLGAITTLIITYLFAEFFMFITLILFFRWGILRRNVFSSNFIWLFYGSFKAPLNILIFSIFIDLAWILVLRLFVQGIQMLWLFPFFSWFLKRPFDFICRQMSFDAFWLFHIFNF